MKGNRYLVGILVALLLSVTLSVAACAQEAVPEQPLVPEETPAGEQPTAPEGQLMPEEQPAPEHFPMDEAIKAALAVFPEAQAVSAKFTDPLFGDPVYLIELSNGMEVKVDAQTGEVLDSTELSEPSPAVTLLPQTTVSLEQAVSAALSTKQDRAAVEAQLVEEENNIVYVIKLDNGEEIRVDATTTEEVPTEEPTTEAEEQSEEAPAEEELTTPAEESSEVPAEEAPAEEQSPEAPVEEEPTEAPVEEPVF